MEDQPKITDLEAIAVERTSAAAQAIIAANVPDDVEAILLVLAETMAREAGVALAALAHLGHLTTLEQEVAFEAVIEVMRRAAHHRLKREPVSSFDWEAFRRGVTGE